MNFIMVITMLEAVNLDFGTEYLCFHEINYVYTWKHIWFD